MRSQEVREAFLNLLKKDGHTVIPSDSLVPPKELGLLFTNAGMNQFAKYFSGGTVPPFPRLGSVQRCLRVSGKHNDFETVGYSPHHHTFFEMLGYFSLGDYFKEHAIELGWTYFTETLKIPPSKLYVTIHENDDESFNIWTVKMGLSPDRIYRLTKSNFWEMGDTGPCGPSTEIICDLKGGGKPLKEELENSYDYLELGNIVFTQYFKEKDGSMTPLPKKNVDTGLGLERIVRVVQGARTNFETDLFLPIIKKVEEESGVKYDPDNEPAAFRIVADHIKAVVFLISDGINPSNLGRGYVARKLLRRLSVSLRKLGINGPFAYKLVAPVRDIMSGFYPSVAEKARFVESVIYEEEERFLSLLEKGYKKYLDMKERTLSRNERTIRANDIFELYDTYGFPVDIIKEMAAADSLAIDRDGFESRMAEQREIARGGRKKEDAAFLKDIPETVFTGYEEKNSESSIILTADQGRKIKDELRTGEEGIIISASTPFYAESGGQTGDRGMIRTSGGLFSVADTKKEKGIVLHYGTVEEGSIKKGEPAALKIDVECRRKTAVHHTLTHLLHSALREVLGEHVHQAGSLVSPDTLRFDFTHFRKMTPGEIKTAEEAVNLAIMKGIEVAVTETSFKEAEEKGAQALFEAKYGERVRLVEIEGESLELCGGTHILNTKEAMMFKIVSESAVAAGIRRIEALGGSAALAFFNGIFEKYESVRMVLKTNEPLEEIEKLQKELSETHLLKKEFERKLLGIEIKNNASEPGNFTAVRIHEHYSFDRVREILDECRNEFPGKLLVCYQIKDGKTVLAASRGNALTDINISEMLKPKLSLIKGGGGGRPDFMQCGGSDPSGIPALIEALKGDMHEKK